MGVEADAHTDALQDFESRDGKKQTEENRNNQIEKKDNKNRKLENMSKQTSSKEYITSSQIVDI